MKEPKVTLKNVKTFQGMEGTGFNANVYINGLFCYTAIDSGDGGDIDFRPNVFGKNIEQVKEQIKLLDEYIETMPDKEINCGGDKTIKLKMTLGLYIDDLLAKMDDEKHQKKMERLMETSILFGVPKGTKYSYYNYKKPLYSFPTDVLQMLVNQIKTKYCGDGVVILNTNLEKYGVVI